MTYGPNSNSAGIGDPCAILPQLRAAYYDLISGAQTSRIRDGERWREFQKGDTKMLRDEIRRLAYMCPKSAANPYGGQTGASTTARNRVLGR